MRKQEEFEFKIKIQNSSQVQFTVLKVDLLVEL